MNVFETESKYLTISDLCIQAGADCVHVVAITQLVQSCLLLVYCEDLAV